MNTHIQIATKPTSGYYFVCFLFGLCANPVPVKSPPLPRILQMTEKEPASYFLENGEKIKTLLQSALDTEEC